VAKTFRYHDSMGRMKLAHRSPNNHLGRRLVERWSGKSGPVTRFVPGTPEYDELIAQREKPQD